METVLCLEMQSPLPEREIEVRKCRADTEQTKAIVSENLFSKLQQIESGHHCCCFQFSEPVKERKEEKGKAHSCKGEAGFEKNKAEGGTSQVPAVNAGEGLS